MVISLAACLSLFTQQDDRARILDGVESWYKIVQDGKNRGYVHEKLERVKDSWTYAYRADFEVTVKDGWHLEYREVEATLDDDLSVATLEARLEADKVSSTFSIEAGEERNTILVPIPGKHDRQETIERDVHGYPTLLFYSLRQNGRLSKIGRRSSRIVAPRAEGRLDVEASFEVADVIRKEIAGKLGPVTPIRFLKSPPASRPETEWTEALVDKFGRLVETTMRCGAKIVLVEGEAEAFRDSTTVHRTHLRNIFDKKGPMLAATTRPSTPFPDEPRPPKVNADNLLSNLETARKMIEDLRALKEGNRTNDLADNYFLFLRMWKAVREKADALGRADAVSKVDELRDDAESLWDGAARALTSARASFVAATEALDRTDLAALQRELRALKAARGRIELERRPESGKVLQLIAQTEPMVARCLARVELAKKAIVVTGIVLSSQAEPIAVEVSPGVVQNVRFVRDLSTAAINGKSYRAGEEIEEGLRLEKISSRSVTVSYRGELRDVPLGGR